MTAGPGKYDDICTRVREDADAHAAIVIIIEGNKGSGFSVQCVDGMILNLPKILRAVATEMATDLEAMQ